MESSNRVGIDDPERGLRVEHADKLIEAAEIVRNVLDGLDVGSETCPHCHRVTYSNLDEWRAADQLKAIVRRLYRFAGQQGEANTL